MKAIYRKFYNGTECRDSFSIIMARTLYLTQANIAEEEELKKRIAEEEELKKRIAEEKKMKRIAEEEKISMRYQKLIAKKVVKQEDDVDDQETRTRKFADVVHGNKRVKFLD